MCCGGSCSSKRSLLVQTITTGTASTPLFLLASPRTHTLLIIIILVGHTSLIHEGSCKLPFSRPTKKPPSKPLILSRTQTNTHTHTAIQHLKYTRTSRLGRSLAPSPPLKMLHPLRKRRSYPPLPPHSALPHSSVEVKMMACSQGYSSDPRSSTCS